MDLTGRGIDTVGLIAHHIDLITHKQPIAQIQILSTQVSIQINDRPPPVDVVISSELPRAKSTKQTFVAALAALRQSRRSITDLGTRDFLNEGYYPNDYDRFTAYDYVSPINYDHFQPLRGLLAGLHKSYRHIVLFAHAPSIRAISLAIIGKRKGGQGNMASDEIATTAEHELRPEKSEFGMTVTFRGLNWDDILGYGEMVGSPFLPSRESDNSHTLPDGLLRRIIDQQHGIAK